MACCPAGSLGPALLSTGEPIGEVATLEPSTAINDVDAMKFYWTGAPLSSNPRLLVLIFTDVFGLESGNHKVFADTLAEALGPDASVMIPDLFRGNPVAQPISYLPQFLALALCAPGMVYRIKFQEPPEKIERDLQELIFPWLESKMNIKEVNVSVVGFCFGGWVVARALALNDLPIKCGVGIHPSLKPSVVHGTSQKWTAQQVGKKPSLWLPASNDYDLKPSTQVVGVFSESRGVSRDEVSVEFPTMLHGWVTRGDSTKENIAEKQKEALKLTADFITKNQ